MSLKYEPASEPLHISVEWLPMGLHLMFDLVEEMDAPATTRRGLNRKRSLFLIWRFLILHISINQLLLGSESYSTNGPQK